MPYLKRCKLGFATLLLLTVAGSCWSSDRQLTTGDFGTQARFIDEEKTGIIVPGGTSDTLVCDPTMLEVIADSGFGSGRNCLRFTNNDVEGTNYLPYKVNSIVSFVEFYNSDPLRGVCEVSSKPWQGWQGVPETECGAQTFIQSNTCVIPMFGCDDTCPWTTDNQYKIYREVTIYEGSCCDSETYVSNTGLTERQTRGSCNVPETIEFTDSNECGETRTKTLDCMRCDPDAWLPGSEISPRNTAASCQIGRQIVYPWVTSCGGEKNTVLACTG